MHRFFVPSIVEGEIVFSPAQVHQITAVLRLAPGDGVIVLDNSGWEFETTLVVVDRKQVTAVVTGKQRSLFEPSIRLTLYQTLLKRDNFEWVLQKGTELGIVRFVPIITERTVARLPKKFDRWQRILIEAAEQSGRGRLPQLEEPIKIENALRSLPGGETAVMPWVLSKGPLMTEKFLAGVTAVSLFIGPEGGFTESEIELARQHHVCPVSLGKRILRSETAAVAATAVIMQNTGENSHKPDTNP